MGRPKGKKDSAPRARRGQAASLPAPEKLSQRERRVKRQLKDIVRDLDLNDWYIKIGLGVSGIQLAVTFAYITGSVWASAFSIVAAIGKAAFVEAGVWLINRTISHARAIRVHWFWQGTLWLVLFTLMWISVRANVRYEWEKRVEVKNPRGNGVCAKYDEDMICKAWEKIPVNDANINAYLSPGEQAEAWQRGGLIPLLVFASIIIGRVMLSAKDGFEKEEVSKLKTAERGVRYRTRKRKEQTQLAAELGAGGEA